MTARVCVIRITYGRVSTYSAGPEFRRETTVSSRRGPRWFSCDSFGQFQPYRLS